MIQVMTSDGLKHQLSDLLPQTIQAYSSSASVRSAISEAIQVGNYTELEVISSQSFSLKDAYLALINSAVFARIGDLAAASIEINLRYTNLVAGFSQGVAGAWLPEVVSVSIERLSEALDQDGESFSEEERNWLSGWNEQFKLTLNFPWNPSV